MSFGGFDPPPPKLVGALTIALQQLVSLGGFDPPPPTLFGMRPLHLNDSFDMCPIAKCFSIAHIRHIHFFDVSIFLIYHRVVSINRPSGYEPDALPLRHDDGFVIGWFRSTSPDAEVVSTLPLRYNDSFDMCPIYLLQDFSIAHIRHIHFFDVSIFLIYHRVVSINRPSGYEPDALPLRHDDGVSLGGFDPPPLGSHSTWYAPITLQ